jgi:CBS domain-containing protein
VSTTTTPSRQGSYLIPSIEHATVSDAMHPGIFTCDADATMTDVARLMTTHHIHCVAVMGISHEASVEKLAWGIISDLDLLRTAMSSDPDRPAGSLALEPPITVEPTMPLRQAGALMLSRRSDHLVVIDSEVRRPIGILSTLDIAGMLAWGEA